jgi:hypothetical protein
MSRTRESGSIVVKGLVFLQLLFFLLSFLFVLFFHVTRSWNVYTERREGGRLPFGSASPLNLDDGHRENRKGSFTLLLYTTLLTFFFFLPYRGKGGGGYK